LQRLPAISGVATTNALGPWRPCTIGRPLTTTRYFGANSGGIEESLPRREQWRDRGIPTNVPSNHERRQHCGDQKKVADFHVVHMTQTTRIPVRARIISRAGSPPLMIASTDRASAKLFRAVTALRLGMSPFIAGVLCPESMALPVSFCPDA
jgi:hypothetical protein